MVWMVVDRCHVMSTVISPSPQIIQIGGVQWYAGDGVGEVIVVGVMGPQTGLVSSGHRVQSTGGLGGVPPHHRHHGWTAARGKRGAVSVHVSRTSMSSANTPTLSCERCNTTSPLYRIHQITLKSQKKQFHKNNSRNGLKLFWALSVKKNIESKLLSVRLLFKFSSHTANIERVIFDQDSVTFTWFFCSICPVISVSTLPLPPLDPFVTKRPSWILVELASPDPPPPTSVPLPPISSITGVSPKSTSPNPAPGNLSCTSIGFPSWAFLSCSNCCSIRVWRSRSRCFRLECCTALAESVSSGSKGLPVGKTVKLLLKQSGYWPDSPSKTYQSLFNY